MKQFLIAVLIAFSLFINVQNVAAGKAIGTACDPRVSNDCADLNLICKSTNPADPSQGKCEKAQISVKNPDKGFVTLGNAISNIITVAFAVALILVLIMLIWGAFEWITSGGDKEAVGKARGKILNALIGLAVLAIAFALVRVAGQFTGLDINNLTIPAPDPNASGL